jgi:hypothetical protein
MLTKDSANQGASLWENPRGRQQEHSNKIARQHHPGPRLRYAIYGVIALLSTAAWAYDPKHSLPILCGFTLLVFLMVALERRIGRDR